MDTCSNCGATLRPGARFCTTCGTRLNAVSSHSGGWGTPTTVEPDSQQTAVITTAPPATPPPADTTMSVRGRTRDWGGTWQANDDTASDPASRFISALDAEVKPTPEAPEASASQLHAERTWSTPAPDAFVPPPTWSHASDDAAADTDTWRAPVSWTTDTPAETVSSVTPNTEADLAPDSVHTTEEPAEAMPASTLSAADARARAIALADELRAVLRQVPAGGDPDEGSAAMTLTEASLDVSDFDDVRKVVANVQEDPRDIQALTALAAKIDRIEALLGEHAMLHQAVEEAISQLSG